GLRLAEPLLETVEIAAGEIFGLLDDAVARYARAKRAELSVQALDLGRSQMRDLFEAEEAESVQRVGEFRTDAFHPAKIVARLALTVELAVDARSEKIAGHVA